MAWGLYEAFPDDDDDHEDDHDSGDDTPPPDDVGGDDDGDEDDIDEGEGEEPIWDWSETHVITEDTTITLSQADIDAIAEYRASLDSLPDTPDNPDPGPVFEIVGDAQLTINFADDLEGALSNATESSSTSEGGEGWGIETATLSSNIYYTPDDAEEGDDPHFLFEATTIRLSTQENGSWEDLYEVDVDFDQVILDPSDFESFEAQPTLPDGIEMGADQYLILDRETLDDPWTDYLHNAEDLEDVLNNPEGYHWTSPDDLATGQNLFSTWDFETSTLSDGEVVTFTQDDIDTLTEDRTTVEIYSLTNGENVTLDFPDDLDGNIIALDFSIGTEGYNYAEFTLYVLTDQTDLSADDVLYLMTNDSLIHLEITDESITPLVVVGTHSEIYDTNADDYDFNDNYGTVTVT
ncbi:hypothetical protein HCZ23_14235 [Celeribacter sp. HF31]|uniref:hypothetical protein n=1 Tax=Celeribacter sp. HF31 TaxID=2721558 RepID=UPI0014314B8C|nr:hypothetical protein [Celeribacter sp. HF31]NIY80620.1 hypothetical protein [Celeribacter sp. HF31]